MSFAAGFPNLVNSIVLLGPAGLLRRLPDDYVAFPMRYPYAMPSRYLRKFVGKVLGVKPSAKTQPSQSYAATWKVDTASVSQTAEVQTFDMAAIAQWQYDYHKGFVQSFVDTIQQRLAQHQHRTWKRVCDTIRGESLKANSLHSDLHNGKILVIFGESDDIVPAKEVSTDLQQLLQGEDHLEIRMVLGNHGFLSSSSTEVVSHIRSFWGL